MIAIPLLMLAGALCVSVYMTFFSRPLRRQSRKPNPDSKRSGRPQNQSFSLNPKARRGRSPPPPAGTLRAGA
jgi:hypothetical protein